MPEVGHSNHWRNPCRDLWQAVLLTAITDYRNRVMAARAGLKYNHQEGVRRRVLSEGYEVDSAREYFHSRDGRQVISLAGFDESHIDQIMREVTREGGKTAGHHKNRTAA